MHLEYAELTEFWRADSTDTLGDYAQGVLCFADLHGILLFDMERNTASSPPSESDAEKPVGDKLSRTDQYWIPAFTAARKAASCFLSKPAAITASIVLSTSAVGTLTSAFSL